MLVFNRSVGVDLEVTENTYSNNRNALMIAVEKGDHKMTRMLLDAGSNVFTISHR